MDVKTIAHFIAQKTGLVGKILRNHIEYPIYSIGHGESISIIIQWQDDSQVRYQVMHVRIRLGLSKHFFYRESRYADNIRDLETTAAFFQDAIEYLQDEILTKSLFEITRKMDRLSDYMDLQLRLARTNAKIQEVISQALDCILTSDALVIYRLNNLNWLIRLIEERRLNVGEILHRMKTLRKNLQAAHLLQ